MTDAEPAADWWAKLTPEERKFWFLQITTPEERKFWFLQITGWSIEAAVKAAYARAMTEAKLGEAAGTVTDG
jgi:hypothetical protein